MRDSSDGQHRYTYAVGPVVHIEDHHMTFGPRVVIDRLSFDSERGESFSFLASNGSGKTTTIRALVGIYLPTAGVLCFDKCTFSPEHEHTLNSLPDTRSLREGIDPQSHGLLRAANGADPRYGAFVVGETYVVGLVAMRLAFQFFRYGTTKYAREVSIRAALGVNQRGRPGWRAG